MPGCPQDPGVYHGPLNPQAIVLHRTYGAWGGDYSVGKQGIFQFLLGKDEGNWVQFAPTEIVQYHCNGANFRAFGIEIEGTNEDALTDWQLARLGDILRWANTEHGIPLVYQDPAVTPPASIWVNQSNFTGVISHVSVQTDDGSQQHTDEIDLATFNRAVAADSPVPAPTPILIPEDLMEFTKNPYAKDEVWCLAANTRRHVSPAEWKRAQTPYYPGGPYHLLDLTAEEFDTYPDVAA